MFNIGIHVFRESRSYFQKSSQGGDVSFSDVAKYSLDELMNNPPDGVDPAHKEVNIASSHIYLLGLSWL